MTSNIGFATKGTLPALSESQLETLELLPHAIVVFGRDAKGQVAKVYSNARAGLLLGMQDDPADPFAQIAGSVHPEDLVRVQEAIARSARDNQGADVTYRLTNALGKTVWVHLVSKPQSQVDGSCLFYATLTDVTDQVAVEKIRSFVLDQFGFYFEKRFDINDMDSVAEAMTLQREVFASIVGTYTTVELCDLDNDTFVNIGCLDYVKSLMEGVTSTQEVLDRVVNLLLAPEFKEAGAAFYDTSTWPERLRDEGPMSIDYNGSIGGWLRSQIIPVAWHEDGRCSMALCTVQRLHDNKMEIERLRKLSETDGLTQLLNRTSGESYINRFLSEGRHGVFCIVDVDNFKHFNDQYGHSAGDDIICAISDCMRTTFRGEDVLMRVGGDEFGVFAPGILDAHVAEAKIADFATKIASLKFSQFSESVSVSVGMAFSNNRDFQRFAQIFRAADGRMYEAKRKKKAAQAATS